MCEKKANLAGERISPNTNGGDRNNLIKLIEWQIRYVSTA